ncbi:bacitracin ABC transporter ATP-binding protein [Robertmurraya yapensis]|uniref:Bacitracin ABC transporter ATP-binding protein n=2 Tax=Bacillaceae TaxID=186817 RepID=A0A3S0RHC3_9BACI|nr:hypothetical protein [Bacillus yapensis]RTR28412.1 bacitracin ABC transporter ATP-binding protein [Bacillus yapensis]TKS94473.1 bacitracin ABC transporter ATP-binding protein [Bacillus yapensis]
MLKENDPLLSDEFLDELAKEINDLYGWEESEEPEDDIKK